MHFLCKVSSSLKVPKFLLATALQRYKSASEGGKGCRLTRSSLTFLISSQSMSVPPSHCQLTIFKRNKCTLPNFMTIDKRILKQREKEKFLECNSTFHRILSFEEVQLR